MKKTIIYHTKKHLSLITCMLIASGVLFIGVCTYLAVTPVKGYSPAAVTKAASLPATVVSSRYDINYPVIHDKKIDTLLRSYASKQVTDFTTKLGKDVHDPRNRMTLDYVLQHRGSQFATVLFTQREYLVNSPVRTERVVKLFDIKKQVELSPKDLFVSESDAQVFIGALLYDYFKQYAAHDFTQEQFASLLQLNMSAIHNIALTSDSIVLHLNPKNPASDQDIQTIAIKRSLLDSVLQPDYTNDDGGVDVPLVATYTISQQPKQADNIDPNQKMLAMTFDDGPGNYTNKVLDTLRRNRSHGTFFVIGRQVPKYADVVKRIVQDRNEVGNHSWDHAFLPVLSHDQLAHQIDDTQGVIQQAASGYTPTLMRPPYGATNDDVAGYLQQKQLHVALWNVDTEDWRYPDAQAMYDRIMQSAADGSVILLHDIHPTSVEAIERAVPALVAQGYQLVTMSQLERYR